MTLELSGFERSLLWIFFLAAMTIAGLKIYHDVRLILCGRRIAGKGQEGKRFFKALQYVLLQQLTLKDPVLHGASGIGHLFIVWGAIALAFYYLLALFIGDGLGLGTSLRSLRIAFYLGTVAEITSILLLAAIAVALIRRAVAKPARLGPRFDTGIFVGVTAGILFLIICSFTVAGLRFAAGESLPGTPVARFVGDFIMGRWNSEETLVTLFQIAWWAQYLILLGFIIYAPHSHHKHPIYAPVNIFLNLFRKTGIIDPVDLAAELRLGASKARELSSGLLLEGFACAQCGRCQEVCPAHRSGKPLSPKELIAEIHGSLVNDPDGTLKPSLEEVLSCTACGACVEVCPVLNRPLDDAIEVRRNLVYEGVFDPGHRTVLKRVAADWNPYGVRWNKRARNLSLDLARPGETYDILYWLGCAAAFDERVQNVATAVGKILNAAGLKIAILGTEEKCCGDFVRRIGDEGLFQHLAAENIKTLGHYSFSTLLAHCPHCFHVLAREYPQFGGSFPVLHHSQLLATLLKEGRIGLQEGAQGGTVAYHDPCYLGRYDGIYEEPRQVLAALNCVSLKPDRERRLANCCGAGGGHIWKEQEGGTKMSIERFREFPAEAQTIAVSCPFCLSMFEEAVQIEGRDDIVRVRDIAEITEACAR